jgi:uncharacterized membrane protein
MPSILLSTHCNPIRMSVSAKDTMTVTVKVKNVSEKPQMASVDLEIPKELGFDMTGVSQKKNAKLGDIAPGETKEAEFEVHTTHRAMENDYKALIMGYVHYRDYSNVIEKVPHSLTIRVLD